MRRDWRGRIAICVWKEDVADRLYVIVKQIGDVHVDIVMTVSL